MAYFCMQIVKLSAAAAIAALLVATPAAARPKAQPAVEQARALVQGGKAEQAIAFLTAAVAKTPSDAAAHNMLGGLFNRSGRYREALVHAHAAAELKPDEPRYRYNRGIVLAEHGRFAEALADFDFAIGRLPGEAPMYLERGAAHLSLGRDAEARADWASARRLDPRLVWTDWYEGLHDLIDGNNGLAIRRLSTVALLQPDFASAQPWLSAAHLIAGMPYRPKPVADPWARLLLDYHAGRATFGTLLAAANADTVTGDRRRVGEAWLHHGLRLQRDGLLTEARAAFAQAAAVDAPRHAWKLLAERQRARS